jgi:hypothetical protein
VREDGLAQDWTDEIVYCHPLFDTNIGAWVKKAFQSNCTTVLLLPAATHTAYFHNYIYGNPRCEIRFLRKPSRGFRFGADDGAADDPARLGYIRPLMIVIFRNNIRNNSMEKTFVTSTQLAATFAVSRDVIETWLVQSALRTTRGTPTEKAKKEGWCKLLPGSTLVLWHRHRTVAALGRLALWNVIGTARPALGWGEIQEVVIAAKAREHGVEARVI